MKLTATVLKAILAKMIATGGPFDPAALFIGVGTAYADNGQAEVLADITIPTGAMATALAVTPWSDPHMLNNGCWCVDGPALTFAPADSTEAATLAVWFYSTLATAGVLKGYQPIAPAVPLANEFSTWTIVPRLSVDPLGNWDFSISFNG
ncbi:MAG TPA: hypothetical protein VH092_38370 [Urbifossiella sp.]|jgi:hypothetical protein|nr:hypothetical protein [Urbifossiella sp.]